MEQHSLLASNVKAVLQAFTKGSYTLRTLGGLAKDAGLVGEEVNRILTELIARKLVDQVQRNGEIYFFLTSSGRSAVYEIERSTQSALGSFLGLLANSPPKTTS